MQQGLTQLLFYLGATLLGSFLRTAGILSKQDARAASIALTYVTLPSLVFQSLLTFGFVGWAGAWTIISAVLLNTAVSAVLWQLHSKRRPAERALFTGSANTELGSVAYAFIQTAFDAVGLHFAILWDLGNVLSVRVISRMIMGQGSNKAPERYQHADGGLYRGEWRGGKKHGVGVYVYPNGARYEGRWVDNMKQGLGIYYYPKGGWYEGEWRQGERSGLGIRTLSSGRTKAGLWQGQSILEAREPGQCAFVASQAREVALVAKKVKVGQHDPIYAIVGILKQPLLWVTAGAAASIITATPIPLTVDFMSGHLATAHIPLALITFGVGLDLKPPETYQVKSMTQTLAVRSFFVLVVGLLAAALLARSYTDLVAVAVICALGPISEQVPYYAQLFNLNATLGSQLYNLSKLAAISAIGIFSAALLVFNPGEASVSRVVLLTCLGGLLGLTATIGSLAAWMLTQRKLSLSVKTAGPKFGSSRGNNSVQIVDREPQSSEPEIPIGAAWEEMRREKALEKALNKEKQSSQESVSDDGLEGNLRGTSEEESQTLADDSASSSGQLTGGSTEDERKGEAELSSSSEGFKNYGDLGATQDSQKSEMNRRQRRKRRGPVSGSSGPGFVDVDGESGPEAVWREPMQGIHIASSPKIEFIRQCKRGFLQEALPCKRSSNVHRLGRPLNCHGVRQTLVQRPSQRSAVRVGQVF